MTRQLINRFLLAISISSGFSIQAQANDNKTIRAYVGYVAGSSTDIAARIVSQALGDELKQNVIVENRGGAAGNIAADATAKSAGDGSTILIAQNGLAISVALNTALPFNGTKDLIPIVGFSATPHILVVGANSPYKNVGEIIAAAKKEPGKLTYASSGIGNSDHMAGEMFNVLAGLNTIHVPYKGGAPAATDTIGGQIDYYFAGMPVGLAQYRGGKMRALAVTSKERFSGTPEVPTMQESGVKDYEITLWQGIFMPASTPIEMQKKISEATLKVLSQQSVKDSFTKAGINMAPLNQDDFKKLFLVDIGRWKDIAKKSNIKLN
ncbi:Bug family tripartite tricarboxylate transporter substrate binding protein [Polynucleobacter kasalickyi]|uniref:Tripartite-type tricarboxylate transporter, receptor component TctC n=1 Tax=Polynucleobacter kasalickyi TaxID=1938817 RepID=A0A1W1Y363_9BURK|nr:tripartite tricarboxylate transporter substrate binding protein [Polynucleobacter kasalickyi]SMC30613.1 Tripartite-type tricarboxylate transporter, receptor component TctC [Polynucleobacter kasalickyi]